MKTLKRIPLIILSMIAVSCSSESSRQITEKYDTDADGKTDREVIKNSDRDIDNQVADNVVKDTTTVKTERDINMRVDSANVDADNSAKNERDTKNGLPTPENQKENETDLTITQKIRQAVVADDSLSMNAENVKIVSMNGQVTLRGPVETTQEKEKIGAKAREVAGVTNVDNQIEVKNQ